VGGKAEALPRSFGQIRTDGLLPAGFFFSVLSPTATEPNRLIYLAFVWRYRPSGRIGCARRRVAAHECALDQLQKR
jgi:hypothetical protein